MSGGLQWYVDNSKALTGFVFTKTGKIEKKTIETVGYQYPEFIGVEPEWSFFETKKDAKKAYRNYLKTQIKMLRQSITKKKKLLKCLLKSAKKLHIKGI